MRVAELGKKWFTDNWKLCKPLETTDDVVQVKNWAFEVYVSLAMVNYPYPANFLAPLPANPVKVRSRSRTKVRKYNKY